MANCKREPNKLPENAAENTFFIRHLNLRDRARAQAEIDMLLSISTNHRPATELGYLLHKHPDRFQSFDLSFGKAHVFYSAASDERCEVRLLLDVDAVGMARRNRHDRRFLLGHYVNDRPYVASSLMSVAISRVFGSALGGRCKDRPDLVATPIPLVARLDVLPVRGGELFLRKMFEPLGYQVDVSRHPLDEQFSDWGEGPFFSVEMRGNKTLSELLTHLYVLIPVFDDQKHYFVGDDELRKLLAKGSGWLATHPEKESISRRYLKHQPSLYRQALARLVEDERLAVSDESDPPEKTETGFEGGVRLNDQRHAAVVAQLQAAGARNVLDLGCGEGKLLRRLLQEKQFESIVGMDVSVHALEVAHRRLKLDRIPDERANRLRLIHGSLIYRDERLRGFDAAAVVEVIEHLDPPRLAALERAVFEFARPRTVVVTTPNREYNVMWDSLPAGEFRHADHRFEWTRSEFQAWAARIAERFRYSVRFFPIGPEDEKTGAPTQMGVFQYDEARS